MPSRSFWPGDLPIRSVLRRSNIARDGVVVREPTRPGERCELSDLLIDECACRIHKKGETLSDPREAQEEELDFR